MVTIESRVSSKNQVTLPAEVRKKLGISPHSRVAFVIEGDTIRIERRESVVVRTAGILKSTLPPLSAEELREIAERLIAEDAVRGMDQ